MSILVINAGSSSLKFGLFEEVSLEALASGVIDWASGPRQAGLSVTLPGCEEVRSEAVVPDYDSAVALALRVLKEKKLISNAGHEAISAVGHRVVHGGALFRNSVLIDSAVKEAISGLASLAPLHNRPAFNALTAVEAALPGVPQVAVFDTAFYARMPLKATVYPLPYEWYTDWGVRRFGFHGISHAWCAGRAAELSGRKPQELRVISCHLGNGCSATAVLRGVPVATTMGFTPMDGLMMGTRPGSVDPGILLHVLKHRGLNVDQLDSTLNHGSGLLGVSGVSSDFRNVEASARQGNDRARLALEIYAGRIREGVGALAVTMGGVDSLVFTAGVGENSAVLRSSVCDGLECLGLKLDPRRNAECRPDADISTAGSPSKILVIRTREELLIARETRRVTSKGKY
ncbi:MAG: acetate kinase [Deltaproteobacteria bacterium]|nr:acetate kinase [Deltaproteobacteria bacterium]